MLAAVVWSAACSAHRDECRSCSAGQVCVTGSCRTVCVSSSADCELGEHCVNGACLTGDDPPDTGCEDNDSDGHCAEVDCDDHRASVRADCELWWNSDWSTRVRLRFLQPTQPETLANFVVLVRLVPSRLDYARAAANGADLRFIDADGATVLAHEIAVWQEDGESLVWVKVPSITSSSDFIWMYYGNAVASDAQARAAVWSDGFDAIWHLDGDFADASGQLEAPASNTSTAGMGRLGGGRMYGGDDVSQMGLNLDVLRDSYGATLSGWVFDTAPLGSGYGTVVTVSVADSTTTNLSRASLQIRDGYVEMYARATETENAFTPATSNAAVATNAWHYVTGVIDYAGGTAALYVDGVPQALLSSSNVFAESHTSDLPAYSVVLGSEEIGTYGFFAGTLDEVRIAHVARSAAWVDTDARSVQDTLIAFDASENF